MNSVPPELLYALIFGAVLIVQYLMKRFGRQREPADALQEAPDSGAWGRVPEDPAASLAAVEWVARLEAPVTSAAVPRRRSAARSLLGGGQDLRRTIACMTLLGPCRAQEPPENR